MLYNFKPQGITVRYTDHVATDNLVYACFRRMTSNIWYPILPIDDNNGGDISSAMEKIGNLYLKYLLIWDT